MAPEDKLVEPETAWGANADPEGQDLSEQIQRFT